VVTTDAQWAVIDPIAAGSGMARGQGRLARDSLPRQIVDVIFYVVDNGIKWRVLPVDFPS
jgi:transposase